MTFGGVLLLLILLSSLVPGVLIFFVAEQRRRLRTVLNMSGAVIKLLLVVVLLEGVREGLFFQLSFDVLPGLAFVLHADALSILFIALSAVLWLVTTIYAIGYLENSPNRSRFFGFFSLCVFTTTGIALAGNLFTFLIFYELLTLATYPLVVHRGTAPSLRAGRQYLIYTLGGGVALLIGVVGLNLLAGSQPFTPGGYLGVLAGQHDTELKILFVLMILGFGVKSALVPLHGWLPQAMVAPAPVSALLHAVAVVKAGAFGIVRLVQDVFGTGLLIYLDLLLVVLLLASVTIVYGSLRALMQTDIKRRLAFSTVSQVSYITLGVTLAGPIGFIGGLAHLVHQGLMKITLFFCAGNFAETLGVHRIDQLNGIGRRMPWTMAAFTVGALGMIGLPPMAGFISKWYLAQGALEVGQQWVIGVLILSSLLNMMYFLPVLYRAWFKPPMEQWPQERLKTRWETHLSLLLPPLFTALLALLAGLLAGMSTSPLAWAELITLRNYAL